MAVKLKIETLKNRVSKLIEDEITKLGARKNQLKKSRADLYETCKEYANNVRVRLGVMNSCRLVLDGQYPELAFVRTRDNFFHDVNRARKKGKEFSRVIEQLIDDMKKSVTLSPFQILGYFSRRNTDDERSKKNTEKLIGEIGITIRQIEADFRQTKLSLVHEVRAMESVVETETAQCRADELEWITESREHLLWALEREPSYKNDALRLYEKRWPDDDLSGTPYAKKPASNHLVNLPKPVRKQSSPLQEELTQDDSKDLEQWEFLIVSGKDDLGKKISSKRPEFLGEIQSCLPNNVRGLKIAALYEKLVGLTRMDVHQRQLAVTKILERSFRGWQRLKIGGYRILILIDESSRQIKFMPCKKGEEPY